MASAVPEIALNNGVDIPQLGFGVFQIPPDQTSDATALALEVGYRHIDTAEMYRNEAGVGEAVRASGIDRSEIFVTSKLNNGLHAYDDALAAFAETMQHPRHRLRRPVPGPLAAAHGVGLRRDLEGDGGDLRARRRASSVSPTSRPTTWAAWPRRARIVPAVNQIEVHPYLTNETVRAYCADHGIATEAWSPIAQGGVLDDPTIVTIAERVDRTPAQVTLRWHVQRGTSSSRSR